ncbi:MAG: putative lipid II flippase FtsW [candidate division Zixibacteria bacterium]|nr:putative lipid II flippase FtsW [candidate division Zixibacteria bacterium]MDD5426313.1 putative lipid II flippase FtsW [candidate division Zixibacteria bacterium]
MKTFRTKEQFDEKLFFCYLFILLVGLVMVYSTSSIIAESRNGSHLYYFSHQFLWALMSLAVIYVILRVDLKKLTIYSAPALLLTLVLLVVVFFMPIRNGAHRWLVLGPVTVQPSEIFKFLMICYLAFSLSNPKRNITNLKQLLIPYLPLLGLGLGLILLEPDLGSTIVIFLTTLGIFFLAGARMKHLMLALVPQITLALTVVFVLGYKKARIINYLQSVEDPLQGSYQLKQAVLTLGSGGLLGTGLGDGRQKLFFLPYPHTDFIFAGIGEEIGFIGLLVLLSGFFFIMHRGFKIAAAQPDRFGFLLASGMTWSLFVNIAINLGVVTGLLPVTGLPLPFLSYGGSSLLMSSAAVGVLLNLSGRAVK